jgi:UDPglucose 6-dehydrogenase/GDP-mannose 6-dehydrogenase
VSPLLANGDRITPVLTTYLEAGCGFGGSCFPKDVKALISYGAGKGQPMRLLRSVIDINHSQPGQILDRLYKHYADVRGLRIAILGLAFKPETDDMRESPAIPIVNELIRKQASRWPSTRWLTKRRARYFRTVQSSIASRSNRRSRMLTW